MSQTKAQLIGGVGISTASGLVVSGVVTATSFVGDITGTATYSTSSGISTYATTAGISTVSQGLTGTPNITVGTLTANAISASGTVGSASSVLTSSGTGIYWSQPASGAWTYIGEASGPATTLSFTGITTAYDAYAFVLTDTGPAAANGVPVNMSLSVDNGSSYGRSTTSSLWRIFSSSASGTIVNSTANSMSFAINQDQTIGGYGGGSGIVYLHIVSYSGYDWAKINISYTATGNGDTYYITGGGKSSSLVNAVRFSAGTQMTGKIRLYGIKNS